MVELIFHAFLNFLFSTLLKGLVQVFDVGFNTNFRVSVGSLAFGGELLWINYHGVGDLLVQVVDFVLL